MFFNLNLLLYLMNSSKPVTPSRPFYSKGCKNFRFLAFWSKKITKFVDQIEKTGTNVRVTHHDLLVNFVNKEYLDGEGELDHEKRVKGSKHDDLSLPSKVIEFKFRSSALTSLPGVLRNAKGIFTRNNFLYFAYFRRRTKKDKNKIIKTRGCLYYLIIIVFPKEIEHLNLKVLLKEIRKEEINFTKEVAQKSGIDMDDEELYAVGNMIKEIQLERKLDEKDKTIEEKDKKLEQKDKIIERLKRELNRK
ncbi:hypothetical protein LCGC14_1139730 [marine sediment metagenome]|uniref:Uncharacterized protein n=1 Tax=marine sediment metagenome TaxID=412755 RepID=A0A0F9LYJ8_9ZZZZ|nr:MAG: hypothetical protein Lokiarch_22210 [Candidatus Lokiarchaeum sp. GC14_75]